MINLRYRAEIDISINDDGTVPDSQVQEFKTLLEQAITAHESDVLEPNIDEIDFDTLEDGSGNIPDSEIQRLKNIIDDVVEIYEYDGVPAQTVVSDYVSILSNTRDISAVNNPPQLTTTLTSKGTVDEIAQIEENLAQELVNLGFEPDTQTAKDNIIVS